MVTLVVCLVVVSLSGAAVVHIVLSDAPQRATLGTPPRRDRVPRAPRSPVEPSPARRTPAVLGGAPAPVGSRLRAAILLVGLVTVMGTVLAMVVVLSLVLVARALQGSLE